MADAPSFPPFDSSGVLLVTSSNNKAISDSLLLAANSTDFLRQVGEGLPSHRLLDTSSPTHGQAEPLSDTPAATFRRNLRNFSSDPTRATFLRPPLSRREPFRNPHRIVEEVGLWHPRLARSRSTTNGQPGSRFGARGSKESERGAAISVQGGAVFPLCPCAGVVGSTDYTPLMGRTQQLSLMPPNRVTIDVTDDPSKVEHGAVFTRRWVVELILDLAGYKADTDLFAKMALEPACGDGAFLVPMVERLSAACRRADISIAEASSSLAAFDLQPTSVAASRTAVSGTLARLGWPAKTAKRLAEAWIHQGDFLLGEQHPQTADFVIGNPPYIRLEAVPASRQRAYRQTWMTMNGRSDIYVGFIEAGLQALKKDGRLAFICADRWMRNQYGRHLREVVSSECAVDVLIEMHDVDAFEDEVSAYPAIIVLRRASQGHAIAVETNSSFGEQDANRLASWSPKNQASLSSDGFLAAVLPTWFSGAESWPKGSPERLQVLSALESRFPPLEDPATGTRVGIGVATGADKVFVTRDTSLVEQERLLPLAMAADTKSGKLLWSGHYLVDPWDAESHKPLDLKRYPKLRAYFEQHEADLRGRNVGQRKPDQWYRTIDPVHHWLTARPKLLFPDIKDVIHPVLDDGKLYPHHNLYYVISRDWPIDVLGGLLLSRVAQLFVESYAVRMRGGWLRFQAQYMRRIRLPYLASVGDGDRKTLSKAFDDRDVERATACALRLFGLEELPR